MIQELTLYRSEVTGELFESEKAATNRDNALLKEYNHVLLEENWEYADAFMRKTLLSDAKDPKSENHELAKDLYDVLFSKAGVNNRFYNVNPFEIIWKLEYVYNFNTDNSSGVNKSYFNYKHAAKEWAKDNGDAFVPPVNWLTEKGFKWVATSVPGGLITSFDNLIDGGIKALLSGESVAGKANITDNLYIGEAEVKAKIEWNSAETGVFVFQSSKGIVTFNLALQADFPGAPSPFPGPK